MGFLVSSFCDFCNAETVGSKETWCEYECGRSDEEGVNREIEA